MISDEDVYELFQECQRIRSKCMRQGRETYSQFFRGKVDRAWENHHPGGCKRDMTIFRQHKVIPKYCFDCYKVSIEPRTVMDLFKLMMVFERLELPSDNTRKCMVEGRPEVSGTYKGFIYCRGIEEAENIRDMIRIVVSEEISEGIPITLKRGCSEYALVYPEYAQIGKGAKIMTYNEEWRVYEDHVDDKFVIDEQILQGNTYNQPTYTLQDADTMFIWLQYAASIGDMSYTRISGVSITPFSNWKRPSPFLDVESGKKRPAPKVGRNEPCTCGSGRKYKKCCGNKP